jgi:glycosyltransferase involved in cell wall biosynthesis
MKKNLIFFYPSYERGGVTKILLNLLKNHNDKNTSIHVISSENFLKNINKNKNVIFHKTKNKFEIPILPNRFGSSLNSMLTLNNLLNNLNGPTIVHSMQSNIAAIIICILKKRKIIIRNSENPIYSALNSENKLTASIVIFLKLIFYNFCDGVITNSLGSAKSLKLFFFNKKKIKQIYNPYILKINKKKFKKEKYFLNIGRLRKQKDHVTLLKAFQIFLIKNDKYKLIILGHGNLEDKLKTLVKKLKISKKVVFKGWVEDTLPYVKKSKFFVLSSVYEGLGNVLLDAINYDTPCISTDCPSGPKEILLNGNGGYLVKTKSFNELATKMEYCAKNYQKSVLKNRIAKKKLNRFLIFNNTKKYFNYLKSFY